MDIFIDAILGLLGAIIFLIFLGILLDFINPRASKTSNINRSKEKITKIVNFKDIQKNSKSYIKNTSKTSANKAIKSLSDFKVVCSCGHETFLPKKISDGDLTIKNINQFYRNFICSSCGERRVKIFYKSEKILDINGIRLCEQCNNPIPLSRLKINPNALECVKCLEKLEAEEEIYRKLKGRRPL